MKDYYVRITKECDARGAVVGNVYQVIEEKRDEYRCRHADTTQYAFYVRKDCCQLVDAGACNTPNWETNSTWQVPENVDFAWHLDKVTKSVTDLLKEKNKAYGNSALKPANIFSKLDAVESLLVRMDDKIMRIKNKGINDQTEDTVMDLIGYLLLLKMAIERKK